MQHVDAQHDQGLQAHAAALACLFASFSPSLFFFSAFCCALTPSSRFCARVGGGGWGMGVGGRGLGLRFRVWGSGFEIQGLKFRVQGETCASCSRRDSASNVSSLRAASVFTSLSLEESSEIWAWVRV